MKKIHEEFVMEIGNIKVTHTVEETSAETGSKRVTTDNFELDDIRIESSGTNKGKKVSAIKPAVVASGYAKTVPVIHGGTIEPFILKHKATDCDTCKVTSCSKNPNFDPETANESMFFGSFADFMSYLMHEVSDDKEGAEDEIEGKSDPNDLDHVE